MNCKKKNVHKFIIMVIAIITMTLNISMTTHASKYKTIHDMENRTVKVSKNVTRIADLWHANNQVVLLLNGQNKLVATTGIIKNNFWFNKIYPKIKNIPAPFNGNDIQIESLLKVKPDVVLSSNKQQIKQAENAHIPAINVMFQNFHGLKKSVNITAKIIGGKAPTIAKNYNEYLNKNIKTVQSKTKNINNRPTVLHIASSKNLTQVDGKQTIINQWINIAGGKNVINKKGNMISITPEQIIKANPKFIIVGQSSSKQALSALKKNPQLKNLPAVKEHHVYGNPQGTFPWDRYSAEEALQVLWAAKLFHPNLFKNINMIQKTQQFYKQFYNFNLTKQQAKDILECKK